MSTALTSILSVIPGFLRAIASAPASASFITPSIDSILLAGAALIEAGDAAATELAAFTDQIKAMATAGRDPTAEEWAALKARSDAAHALIQGVPTLAPAPGGAP